MGGTGNDLRRDEARRGAGAGHFRTDAAALQTIRSIGDAEALDAAVDDAFPGARVIVESHDGRFETTMQQHGLLPPPKAVEKQFGETTILEPADLDRPAWKWIAR